MGNRALRVSALAGLVLAAVPSVARAQAWTPAARTLSVDGSYQLGYATHTETVELPVLHHYFLPSVEYGVTDNFAISASMPFIATKCGECPTLDGGSHAHGSYDDGAYHVTPTDFRITARYMVPLGFLSVTPQLGASVPVRNYEWAGNAAAGRGLKAAYVGLNIGADLDRYIPRSTFHLAYELALVEKFTKAGPEGEMIGENFSSLAAQFGHTIGKLGLHLGVDYHLNHDGVAFSEFSMITALERKNHDPILRETILLLGGGGSYDVGDHTRVYAGIRVFVSGENTANASSFEIGGSWDFDL